LGFAEETAAGFSAGKPGEKPAAELLDYRTSADITGEPADSFVGYMALCWRP
jgi:predicted class III extradiol MEMO1 family dioxygenase